MSQVFVMSLEVLSLRQHLSLIVDYKPHCIPYPLLIGPLFMCCDGMDVGGCLCYGHLVRYSYFTLVGVVITNVSLEFFRQRGLAYFHAVYVVPINQVVLIVMGTVLGGLYFQEFQNMNTTDGVMFSLAILMTVIGVFILAFNSGNVSEKTEAIINHTITLSLDPNPAMHPLPVPKIITTSPSMPITRPMGATIPDLPPPGMAGTIARIHGLQRSMATLQYTNDGKPFQV